MRRWAHTPQSGSTKIPMTLYDKIYEEVEAFACTRPWYPDIQLRPRFKGQFCYIDTFEERNGEERSFPLCRFRYLNSDWSMALFTYSNERYEPCILSNGRLEGTIEEGLAVCDPFIF